MCVSRFHRVVGCAGDGSALVADSRGVTRTVALMALDGPAPRPGDWLVVHSGYALDRVDRDACELIGLEIDGIAGKGGRP